jgi:hypothetical protein
MKYPPTFVRLASAILIGSALAPALGAGQVGEHGKITTRSDVRMSIEGSAANSGKKLEALAKPLGTALTEVKRCYAELVKGHPEVVGTLTVQLDLPEGQKGLKVRAPGAEKELKPMQRCVDKAFGKLDVKDVPRPAQADVVLELTNSAAAGAEDVRQQGAEAAKVPIQEKPDGSLVAHGASLQGEVSFDVASQGASGRDAIEHVYTSVRDALPGLFDCRRRAGKKASPEGDLVFQLRLSPSAKPSISSKSSSVANERAPICTEHALKQMLSKGGKGAVVLTVHFHP